MTILFVSNGKKPVQFRVHHDTVSPAVYLSVIELLLTFLSLYALSQGLVIYFWHNLLRGTTVRLPPSLAPIYSITLKAYL